MYIKRMFFLFVVILVLPSCSAQKLVNNDYNEIFHLISGPKPILDDSEIGSELKDYLKNYGPSEQNFPKKFNQYNSNRQLEFEIDKMINQIDLDFNWRSKNIRNVTYTTAGTRTEYLNKEITTISQPIFVTKNIVLCWVSTGNALYEQGGTYFYLLEKKDGTWKILDKTQLSLS